MVKTNFRKIWITWERQRRNITLSSELGAELFEIIVKKGRLSRYLISALKTIKIILKRKPEILFIQNPSLALALLAVSLKIIFRYKLIIDEHNSGLFPLEGAYPFANFIAQKVAVSADYVVVTNDSLAEVVRGWGAKPLVLPDPLPNQYFKKTNGSSDDDIFDVFFVCTWAKDEPFEEVIGAARKLGDDFRITVSGNWRGKIDPERLPRNIILAGFLSESDYISALEKSKAVLVLTTRDNCLNCGAYEAVAAEKPLILSDKEEIRKYFDRGVIYTQNDESSVYENLIRLKKDYTKLAVQISDLKAELSDRWVGQKEMAEVAILGEVGH